MELDLSGRQVLVIEDDYAVARSLIQILEVWRPNIVGPAPSVEAALALVQATEHIDFALIDINLRGHLAYPIVDALIHQ